MTSVMKNLHKIFAAVFVLFLLALSSNAQTVQRAPRQERLLNGLKVLIWNEPANDRVMLRLRIHSGSAFDQQGKEGMMKILAETIFPNEQTREFFTEDLGGQLEVISSYDHIQINASSRADAFLTMIETIASAVATPAIEKETTDVVKQRLSALLDEAEESPEYIADRAAAERLFGTFPYGRPEIGTRESLGRIDFADIRFAYDRFFGADNATLTISGKVDPSLAYRAARRYFGAWKKSDKLIAPTFRQPDAPDTSLKLVEAPGAGPGEVRYAVRGVARKDKDYAAFTVLTSILDSRIKAKAPAAHREHAFARSDAYILPGILMFGLSQIETPINTGSASDAPEEKRSDGNIARIFDEKITQQEFSAAIAQIRLIRNGIDPVALWLDVDTYGLPSVKAENDAFASVTLADVQRVADRTKALPMVTVVVIREEPAREEPQETAEQTEQ